MCWEARGISEVTSSAFNERSREWKKSRSAKMTRSLKYSLFFLARIITCISKCQYMLILFNCPPSWLQYENECEMRKRSCELGVPISQLHEGPCLDLDVGAGGEWAQPTAERVGTQMQSPFDYSVKMGAFLRYSSGPDSLDSEGHSLKLADHDWPSWANLFISLF